MTRTSLGPLYWDGLCHRMVQPASETYVTKRRRWRMLSVFKWEEKMYVLHVYWRAGRYWADTESQKNFYLYLKRGARNFQKLGDTTKVYALEGDMKQVHSDDPQILGASVENLVTTATWRLGFVYPCFKKTFQMKTIRSFKFFIIVNYISL